MNGLISGLKDKAVGVINGPAKWIDDAQTDQQRRIRTAVVCCGMIALGVVLMVVSLAMMKVIGAGGFNISRFKFSLETAPILVLGMGLVGLGIGFGLDRALNRLSPEKRQMADSALRVFAWMCGTAAIGSLMYLTFHAGVVNAMTSSTQVIIAPIALCCWGFLTYGLLKNWNPSAPPVDRGKGIYAKDIQVAGRNDSTRKANEQRAKRIEAGRELDKALRAEEQAKRRASV